MQSHKVSFGRELKGFDRGLEARIDLHEVWRAISGDHEIKAVATDKTQASRHFLCDLR
jgi:hypothetical protein